MRDFLIDDSVSQFLIAQRVLSDVSARLVREADDAEAEETGRPRLEPRPSGRYTTSLESLISEGNRYGTIYADPPWPCEQVGEPGSFFWREQISVEALAALPVHQLAAPSSHVHIWTTDEFLLDARKIIEAWGFTYKNTLVWIKPHLGDGDCCRVSHEYLLLGMRGNAVFTDYRPRSWFFEAPNSMRPGFKPAAIRHLIERISPGPRLRLFVQMQSEGWTTWEGPSPSYPIGDDDVDDDDCDDDDDNDNDDDDDSGECQRPLLIPQELAADIPLMLDAARQENR